MLFFNVSERSAHSEMTGIRNFITFLMPQTSDYDDSLWGKYKGSSEEQKYSIKHNQPELTPKYYCGLLCVVYVNFHSISI